MKIRTPLVFLTLVSAAIAAQEETVNEWGYDSDIDPNDPTVLAWRQELRFSQHASADDPPMVI